MSPHLPLVLFFCKNPEKTSFLQETLKGTFSVVVVKDTEAVFDWLKNSPIEILFLDYPSVLKSLEDVCFGAQKLTKGKNLPILLIANSLQKSFHLRLSANRDNRFFTRTITSIRNTRKNHHLFTFSAD